MFDKKKLNFWRLAIIFIGFIGITLSALWLSPQGTKATMMNESMANMASMHLKNVTIYDLVGGKDTDTSSSASSTITQTTSNSTQHHEGATSEVKLMGTITTIIIFALLPLLLCGIIILAIVWIK
jgi:hypothetical protein